MIVIHPSRFCFFLLLLVSPFLASPSPSLSPSCNHNNCNATFIPSAVVKSGATETIRLGILLHPLSLSIPDPLSLARLAADHVNNDNSLLPHSQLEIYAYVTTSTQEVVLASLHFARGDLLNSSTSSPPIPLIAGGAHIISADNVATAASQSILSAFDVPQLGIMASSDVFINKESSPTLARLSPTEVTLLSGIARLVSDLKYLNTLVICDNDGYGLVTAQHYTTLATAAGVIIIVSLPVNKNPSPMEIATLIGSVQMNIFQWQIKPIVFLTNPATGWAIAQAFNDAGIYGPKLLYIWGPLMAASYLAGEAPHLDMIDGSVGYIMKPTGTYADVLDDWNAVSSTDYPGSRPYPHSDWYPYDAVLTYAHAFDAVQRGGGDVSNTTQVLNALSSISFSGASGLIKFDQNRDNAAPSYSIMNFAIYNSSFVGSAIYNAQFNNITYIAPLVYYNGSLLPPGSAICVCYNGTCNEASVCVCFEGYSGASCEVRTIDRIHQKAFDYKQLIAWLIPVVVVLLGAFMLGLVYIRRRRAQMVRDIALRQRSEIARRDIKLSDRIGRGASGEVFRAYFRGTEVAVKSLIASNATKSVVEEFMLETAIMCGLRHPNIVMFMGSCFDGETREMLLVMEYMSRGSLHDVLINPRIPIPYELQLHLAAQAAQGMNFLHESNPPIIHCDLKSHNILLDDKWSARISDFGITRFKEVQSKNVPSKEQQNIGTIFWTAPEVLEGQSPMEASDVYSFGIVLWEIFHRSDPYPGKDSVAVAVDVMNSGIRPIMNPNLPLEIQDLIRGCWDQNPAKRPTFQYVMSRLRNISMEHPVYNFASHDPRTQAPSGLVYLVHSTIIGVHSLFESAPRATNEAVLMYTQLLQTHLESYGGYEVKFDEKTFVCAFSSAISAVNWSIACQVSLLHVAWPKELLVLPLAAEKRQGGTLIWRGLSARMSIFSGAPNAELDPQTGRINYFGPVAENAAGVLRRTKDGFIVASRPVIEQLSSKSGLLEQFDSKLCSAKSFENASNEELYQIIPHSLRQRETTELGTPSEPSVPIPHSVFYEGEGEEGAERERRESAKARPDSPLNSARRAERPPSWLVTRSDLVIKQSLGKGQVGDFSLALLDGKEVVVKLLVNQKLKETEVIRLVSDAALLSKISHPNLLPFRALCVEPNHISIIMDYVSKGDLRKILNEDLIPMPLSRSVKIARDIAAGMLFISSHPDQDLHFHESFKSNNVLITKDWEVKITDYSWRGVKDLARTMTSITSVAWTAPEILSGDPITEKCAVYSFAIIMWELITRKVPYQSEHPLKVVAKILSGFRPSLPSDCPAPLQSLVERCWNADAEMRPTWNVIMDELAKLLATLS